MKNHLYGLLLFTALLCMGCGPTALDIGEALPPLRTAGWTNGSGVGEREMAGRVIVLEVFATW